MGGSNAGQRIEVLPDSRGANKLRIMPPLLQLANVRRIKDHGNLRMIKWHHVNAGVVASQTQGVDYTESPNYERENRDWYNLLLAACPTSQEYKRKVVPRVRFKFLQTRHARGLADSSQREGRA
jgi:hypothetical protein